MTFSTSSASVLSVLLGALTLSATIVLRVGATDAPPIVNNGEVIASPVDGEHTGIKSDVSEDPCGPNRSPNSDVVGKKSQQQRQCQGQGQSQNSNAQTGAIDVKTGGAKSSSGSTSGVQNSGNSTSSSKSQSSGTGIGVGGSATGGQNGDQRTGVVIAPSDNSIRTSTVDARVDGRSAPSQLSTQVGTDTVRANILVCVDGNWIEKEGFSASNGKDATNIQGGVSFFGSIALNGGRSTTTTSQVGRENAQYGRVVNAFGMSSFYLTGHPETTKTAMTYLTRYAGVSKQESEEIGAVYAVAPRVSCAKPPVPGNPPFTPPVFVVPTYGCFKQPDGSFAIEATKGRQPLARKVCMEKPF